MNELQNKYGINAYLPKNDLEQFIHPDDIAAMQNHWNNLYLWVVLSTEGEYLLLYNGDVSIRVKPKLFQVFNPQPKFNFGDTVIEKSSPDRKGIIGHVCLHYEKKLPYYLLKIGDKKSSKWNFDEDLELLEKNLIIQSANPDNHFEL
ncbi:MAG: hypothetical protein M3R17_06690 [Bacteroidota bacterium]|nr:hypothetical protein [Bacteroidota bacterium]